MLLDLLLDEFIELCKLRGLSEKTIDCYIQFTNKFLNKYPGLYCSNLDYLIINDYIKSLYEEKLSITTIATYIRHLKVFIRWLEDNEYIDIKLTEKIKIPRSPKKIVRVYTNTEIRQIYNHIIRFPKWLYYRNSAIISLMLDSGLRQAEVCNLLSENINFKDNILKVHGKGNKERFVPLGEMTKDYIEKYQFWCPYWSAMRKTLFVNYSGDPLSTNAVKLLITKMAKELDFEFSSHKLRHNFATNYCLNQYRERGSIDIYKLMVLLGHEDIQTTKRYLHIANQIIASQENISHLDLIFKSESQA